MEDPGRDHHPVAAQALKRAALGLALLTAASGAALAGDERALNLKAWEAFQSQDFAATETLAREAWTAAEASGDRAQAGVAAANVAAALAIRGRFAESLDWSGRADARLAASRVKKAQGRAAASRALIHHLAGDHEAGKDELARAAGLLDAGDWRVDFLRTAIGLYADLDLGTAYDGLTALLERAPGDLERARCLIALGWGAILFGGPALEHFDEALRVLGADGDPETRVFAMRNRGVALMRRHDLAGAEAAFAAALKEARARNDRRLQVILLNDRSLLHVQQGDAARGREADLEAEKLLDGLAEDLRQHHIDDSVLLDFRQLSKLPYLHLAPVLLPLFGGLFDQLAVDPRAAG